MKFEYDLPSDDPISADSYVRRYHIVATLVCVVGLGLAVYSMSKVDSGTFDAQKDSSSPVSAAGRVPSVDAFDLSDSLIPKDDIVIGNPFKDAIPSLTEPKYIPAADADYLLPHEEVIGYTEGGQARAYPLKIMDYHEAVNDQIAATPYVITYCPLCKSVAAFDRSTEQGRIQLGVSGFLYNSNVLFYDKTEQTSEVGLFSQLMGKGVSKNLKDTALKPLPVELTTWRSWKNRHPETEVLSLATGHERDYEKSAYEEYFEEDKLMFPVDILSNRYPKKTMTLGISVGDQQRAYSYKEFEKTWKPITLTETLGDREFTLTWEPESQSLRVDSADPGITWVYSFWFAWYAFHPESEIYSTEKSSAN